MSEGIGCECGIAVAHSLDDTYNALIALQHRGQEAAGIGVKRPNGKIDVVKWVGQVNDFAKQDLYDLLGGDGIYIGHVRYSTSGKKNDPRNAHPHYIGGTEEVYTRHIIARDVDIAGVHNGTLVNHKDYGTEDCDTLTLLRIVKEKGLQDLMQTVPAAYSAIILSKVSDGAAVIRDKYGMRPLWFGKKHGKWVATSEDYAITYIGGEPHREVRPGEISYLVSDQRTRVLPAIILKKKRICFYEWQYLMRKESSLEGTKVSDVRRREGQLLAKEMPAEIIKEIDLVTHVPHTPEPAARGFADAAHKPAVGVFYKMLEERSFMRPEQKAREVSLDNNLYVRDNLNLEGKIVMILDDSIVRGTVIRKVAKLLEEKGVAKKYFGSCTPPIGEKKDGVYRGCYFGVDMPPGDNFAASKYDLKTPEGLQQFAKDVGMDGIFYLSRKSVFKANRMKTKECCTYCIGGPFPIRRKKT